MASEVCLNLKVSENNFGRNQLVFIIAGKTIKKAVSRNKIRRIAREILRKKAQDIKKGKDLTFIFKKCADGQTYEMLEQEISRVLEEKRLIK